MALGDFFAQAKQKASRLYNQFFFDEEAPAPEKGGENYPPQQDMYQQAGYQQPYAQPGYQQPAPQAYGQQSVYQQQNYQQPQPAYQQPAPQPAAPQTQFSAQYQPPERNRRSQQHAGAQVADNVVPISAYRQPQPEQPAPQPVQQAQMQPAQQPVQQPVQQPGASGAARIINARGIGDCRSAIMLLRAGDAVVIVMDGITDPAEMRRYVDTLSGACFSLNATITKVSRYGAYFLAPQGMAVYADQTTSQMNGASPRPAARPAYQPQGYPPQQPNYQPQAEYQPPVNPYPPQREENGFAPRAPESAPQQSFYARAAETAPGTPFARQPEAYGYAPDEYREAAEN